MGFNIKLVQSQTDFLKYGAFKMGIAAIKSQFSCNFMQNVSSESVPKQYWGISLQQNVKFLPAFSQL